MRSPEILQQQRLQAHNQLHDAIKLTKRQTIAIEILKRKPVLLSQTLQTIDDITTIGIKLGTLISEIHEEDYHDFRIYFNAPYTNEEICRLRYESNNKLGLHIDAFSGRSYSGRYYQSQLKAVAEEREIPFKFIIWT